MIMYQIARFVVGFGITFICFVLASLLDITPTTGEVVFLAVLSAILQVYFETTERKE